MIKIFKMKNELSNNDFEAAYIAHMTKLENENSAAYIIWCSQ